jgi:hypothetical protein
VTGRVEADGRFGAASSVIGGVGADDRIARA